MMSTSNSLQFSGGDPLTLTEDHIQSVLSVRRARARIFGENLFSDPAWDMILELYAANLSGRSLPLRELAVTTETPVSTTARWASILEEIGLIETTKTAQEHVRRLS
jgi:hypothetical protein